MKDYFIMEPAWGACAFTAAELDGKRLRWQLPNQTLEVNEAARSEIFASDDGDGHVSVAIRDEFDGPHRGPGGNPIPITIFGVWLTEDGLARVERDTSGAADFVAIAES